MQVGHGRFIAKHGYKNLETESKEDLKENYAI